MCDHDVHTVAMIANLGGVPHCAMCNHPPRKHVQVVVRLSQQAGVSVTQFTRTPPTARHARGALQAATEPVRFAGQPTPSGRTQRATSPRAP